MQKVYDYIFVWWWLASSVVFLEMTKSSYFDKKSILIIEPEDHHPQQTRSFWADPQTIDLYGVPLMSWKSSIVKHEEQTIVSNYNRTRYCQVSSQDRRTHVDKTYRDTHTNTTRVTTAVTGRAQHTPTTVAVHTDQATYYWATVLNSYLWATYTPRPRDISFSQKFVWYSIQTHEQVFDTQTATLMDFQEDGDAICFVYILPSSSTTALVEYTYFTDSSTIDLTYITKKLENYLLERYEYTCISKESGNIPMTSHQFDNQDNGVRHIGTAWWCTKPSSGYTFLNILRDSKKIVAALHHKHPQRPRTVSCRHRRYDTIMLYLMQHTPKDYPMYILQLFAHTPIKPLIAFMNETSTLYQELSIIYALPKRPFIQACIAVTLRTWKLKVQSLLRTESFWS
jgi:lycopene beta-cyclase